MLRRNLNEDADFGGDNNQVLNMVKVEVDLQVKHDPDHQGNKQRTLSYMRERNGMLQLYESEGNSLQINTAHQLMGLSVIKGCPVNPLGAAQSNGQKLKQSDYTEVEPGEIRKVEIMGESNSHFSSEIHAEAPTTSEGSAWLEGVYSVGPGQFNFAETGEAVTARPPSEISSDGSTTLEWVNSPRTGQFSETEEAITTLPQPVVLPPVNDTSTEQASGSKTDPSPNSSSGHQSAAPSSTSRTSEKPSPSPEKNSALLQPVVILKRLDDQTINNLMSPKHKDKRSAETDETDQVQKNEAKNGEDRAVDSGHTYICGDCDLEFPKRCSLFDHIQLAHPETAVQEWILGSNGAWRKGMIRVMKLDERMSVSYKFDATMKKPFLCLKCRPRYEVSCRKAIRSHLRTHFGIFPFSCTQCDKKFNLQFRLTRHLEMHSEQKKYVCKICGAKFGGKCQLKEHTYEHGSFRCEDCGKEFDRKASYWVHCKSHEKGSDFLCEYCGKTFANHEMLRIHLFHHGSDLVENQFPCPQCGKPYKNNKRLRNHIYAAHKRNVVCDVCDKRFHNLSSLNIHMVRNHEKTTPFVCEKCGKGFSMFSQLRTHALTHTGEKPFKCKECSAGFTRSDYLRKHELTHSGEKPYLCNVCGKGFSRKSNLNVHVQGHIRIGDKHK